MAWSLNARARRQHHGRLDSIRHGLRDLGLCMAVMLGFAAMTMLIDFCIDCMRSAMH